MIKRLLPSCLCVSAVSCIGNKKECIMLARGSHNTANTQRHSGNNLYIYICVCVCLCTRVCVCILCECMCMYICIYMCIYVYIFDYVYIYVYVNIYTHLISTYIYLT